VDFSLQRNGTPITSGTAFDRFRRPSPRKSRYELWFNTIASMELAGNAMWWLELPTQRNIKMPLSIRVLDPFTTKVVRDREDGSLIGYETRQGRKKIQLMPDEVVHFMYPNPRDQWWGLAPLTAAMTAVRTDMKAAAYNEQFFENAAQPGGILIYKRTMSKAQQEQVRAQMNDEHGGIGQAHKTAVLAGDWSYQQIGLGQREMEFLEQRRFSREQINAAFGVPGLLTADPNRSNYSTAQVELRIFAETNWVPKIHYIEDVLRAQFFSRFAPDIDGVFQIRDAPGVREDVGDQLGRAEKLWRMGVPLNDIIDMLKLPLEHKPWGDVWWTNPGLVPATDVQKAQAAATVEETAPAAGGNIPIAKALIDDPLRAQYWRGFVERLKPLENRFMSRVRRHLFSMRSTVLENIFAQGERSVRGLTDEEWVQLVLFSMDAETKELLTWVEPFIQQGIEQGGNMVLGELGSSSSFTIESDLGLQAFKDRTNRIVDFNLGGTIISTTFDDVSNQLRDGLRLGENLDSLAKRVQEYFNQAGKGRSRTIARTEVGTAVQAGRGAAMKQEGVEQHEWLSSRDAIVRTERHDHLIDGEVVTLGDDFSNGLRWPLDDKGDASNVINCRCTTISVV
jgi:HK97 family phage portal protein